MSKDQRWYLQESPDSEHYQEFKCISQHCRLQGCHQWFLHQYCTNRGEVVREFQLSGFSLPLTTYHPLLLYDASQQAVPMSARSSNAGRVRAHVWGSAGRREEELRSLFLPLAGLEAFLTVMRLLSNNTEMDYLYLDMCNYSMIFTFLY